MCKSGIETKSQVQVCLSYCIWVCAVLFFAGMSVRIVCSRCCCRMRFFFAVRSMTEILIPLDVQDYFGWSYGCLKSRVRSDDDDFGAEVTDLRDIFGVGAFIGDHDVYSAEFTDVDKCDLGEFGVVAEDYCFFGRFHHALI